MYQYDPSGQMTMLDLESVCNSEKRSKPRTPKSDSELIAVPYLRLNMSPGHVDIFGCHYWELRSPWREGKPPLNTGVAPRTPIRVSLADILEKNPDPKYYLSKTACLGILRRAKERGKELPVKLKVALMIQAGIIPPDGMTTELHAYHINQRDEGIDLHGVSGALMATNNMQMQTFVTQPDDLPPVAFAANQRDEVRDLHDVAGALGAQPGMKQQTFIASFSAGAGASAGGIGFSENITPTLKGTPSGNCMPSLLCLNDQGGGVMGCSVDVTGTLRAQEHGHQPILLESNQNHATIRTDGISTTLPASMGMGGGYVPMLYENHGIDSRYTGPLQIAPTMSARYGTGGNNVPLVSQEADTYCIVGNVIDREPQNGGNGCGYQADLAYTLTATDHHAVFSRQRVDAFCENDVVSTQSARQHKDATDLVWQENNRASEIKPCCGADDNEPAVHLIRRLTPLECERLQAFPDFWTSVRAASDSARYKALGNSVCIFCVDFIMGKLANIWEAETLSP